MEKEFCPSCPRKRRTGDRRLDRFVHYLQLLDAGCPVGRHELLDHEWQTVGRLMREREAIAAERLKKDR